MSIYPRHWLLSASQGLRFSFLSVSREKLARSMARAQKPRLGLESESSESIVSKSTEAGKRCRPVCQALANPNRNLGVQGTPLANPNPRPFLSLVTK